MHQKLLEIPFLHLPIYSYGFMVVLGFLVAILVLTRRGERENISADLILDIGLIAMISGIIGARIAYLIIYNTSFSWAVFNIFDGNLDIIGGIIGWFIPFFWPYLRKKTKAPAGHTKEASPTVKRSPFFYFLRLLVISFICAIVLSRIVYLGRHSAQYDWGVFQIWQGGLVFYGGLILATIASISYLKIRHVPMLKVADLIAPGIMLGEAFGRLGCFLNGCCYGAPSHLPWAVCFPAVTGPDNKIIGSPAFVHHQHMGWLQDGALTSLPVHPTQIYSSIIALCLFIVLSIIWRSVSVVPNEASGTNRKRDGVVLGFLGVLYPLSRFLMEFIRGDNPAVFLGMTASQTVSVAVIIISAIFLLRIFKKTT